MKRLTRVLATGVVLTSLIAGIAQAQGTTKPASTSGLQTAVFAGGCFWGVEAVFEHVKGVKAVVSGYAGGTVANPDYDDVSSGRTGHAESVKVTFDPSVVSYETLLKVFFTVAHDPTQVDRQGNDRGRQYRSAIFFVDDLQREVASAYIRQLDAAGVFDAPIATEVVPLEAFHPAEAYHQDYAARNPAQPYIAAVAAPKVAKLRKQFGDLLRQGSAARGPGGRA